MRDHHDGRAEVVAHAQDQPVEVGRSDRIEAGGGFVEKKQLGVERHRPRQPGPFAHAAGEFGGHVVAEAAEVDQFELLFDLSGDFGGAFAGVLLQRQRDVFRDGHRAEQRAALIGDAEVAHDLKLFRIGGGDDAAPFDADVPFLRFVKPDDVLEQRTLAAAGAAEDAEHLARLHVEVQILLEHIRAVADGQIFDFNFRLYLFRHDSPQ